MGIAFSVSIVAALIIFAVAGGVLNLQLVFLVLVPYAAFAIFIGGMIYRLIFWGNSPVPYRIPTTCGQQKSLSWIKPNKLDNPTSSLAVVGRMFFEVVFFRSLFRNTRMKLLSNGRAIYIWEKWLWLAAILFHWSFFIILIRHLRLFTEPVPGFVSFLDSLDGFFRFGMHNMYLTDVFIIVGLSFLLIRRFAEPLVRFGSMAADYIPLLLIISIALSGIGMKYLFRVDIISVKTFALGLVSFHPAFPSGLGWIFYVHVFLVSALVAYFPFSKLVHAAGIFLSPTRNMANNNRMVRHINPWNHPVKVHTYAEYEEEFGKVMQAAGLPVENESNT